MGADLSQFMATIFTTLFVVGWFKARRGQADAHHWLMFGGHVGHGGVLHSLLSVPAVGRAGRGGKEGFGGSQALYDHVFVPLLIVHIILVVIGLVMAIYMIVLGFRAQMFVGDRRQLKKGRCSDDVEKNRRHHRRSPLLRCLLFALRGATVGFRCGNLEVYAGLITLVAFVLGIETAIQRLLPAAGNATERWDALP